MRATLPHHQSGPISHQVGIDRYDNSAVNHYQRFYARLGPHTGDPVRCAAEAGGGVAVAGTAQVQSAQHSKLLNTF